MNIGRGEFSCDHLCSVGVPPTFSTDFRLEASVYNFSVIVEANLCGVPYYQNLRQPLVASLAWLTRNA